MQFFVRTGLIFISQALSRAQMFPIVLITARGAGALSQKERPASSPWAARPLFSPCPRDRAPSSLRNPLQWGRRPAQAGDEGAVSEVELPRAEPGC